MVCYYLIYVRHAAVAYFNCIPIENLVQFVFLRVVALCMYKGTLLGFVHSLHSMVVRFIVTSEKLYCFVAGLYCYLNVASPEKHCKCLS